MIEVENISKSYGSTRAVDDISFRVERGEVLGFLGPNGAGKSTTMRILTCFIPSDNGTARIAGYDIYKNPIEVRRHIGYLPENNPLYMDMGALEYLRFIGKMRAIPAGSLQPKLQQVIAICGLESIISKDIHELSKGFRQRLGLAQALLHDPDILILDEPTIGLDPHQIIEIRNLIKSIGKEKTVILSSHILPEVSATCDRVLIINQGRIVGSGTPSELASMAKSGQEIRVSIRGPLDDIRNALEQTQRFSEIQHISETDGINRFVLCMETNDNMCEEVFSLVVQNGWTLSELYKEEVNLEDVFLDLTTREET